MSNTEDRFPRADPRRSRTNSARRSPDRRAPWDEVRDVEPENRSRSEPEAVCGVLAKLIWGREG
jgi:hypothetical protein